MKASINKIILSSVLLAAATTACVNDDMTSSGDKVAVQVSASTAVTRAVDSSWGQNDVIGISMLKAESSEVITPYSNYNYVTTDGSSNFTPATSSQIMYFPVDGSNVAFKAYYPYSSELPAGMVAPLSVKDQSSLADLDFMTAEHLAGMSKGDPNVKLHFYHRLAKVLVDLTTEDNSISLEGCKLAVKGLKTTGSYDIMNEKLAVNAGSEADISIPIHNGKGEAIFLPREAGAGVTFEVTTADGGIYTATLKEDVPFKGGYKHTLHIRLMKTPVTVSATIEEWLEGPETKSDVIRVVTGLKDSENVKAGDTLRLFLKDQADYAFAAKFTYNADGKWTTTTPIYWDNIVADPAHFIGTTVIDAKLNDTQMDDILVSEEAAVGQYTGVNLELQHAGSKAIVELKSTSGTFSATELAGATVTFPGYKYMGSVNAKGEFVIGDGAKDIIAKEGVAIFPPQTIQKGDVIAIITIAGRKYEVKANDENFDFGKGVAKKLILDISKSEVLISTKIVPWTEEEHEFKDVRIGSADLAPNSGDLNNGDKLYIYTGDNTDRNQQGGHFTYNGTTNKWEYSTPNTPLRWEDMPATGNMYASITRPAMSNDAANKQLPDYITATPIVNDGGVSNTAINFEMKHCVAKVTVILKSTTYTLDELKGSTVILPAYTTGATMDKGVFLPGATTADIKFPNLTKDATEPFVSDAAYLQPQDIAANTTIVKVTLNGRVYEAKKQSEVVKYEAGKATTLIITIEKSGIQISASVLGWEDKPELNFDALFFEVKNPNSSGFIDGDKITMYKLNSFSKVEESNDTYSYNSKIISATTPWFRDDFTIDNKISAVYPNTSIVNENNDSFNWTTDDSNTHNKDVLVATNGIIKDADAQVDLEFKHVLSKIIVNIRYSETTNDAFTKDELKTCTIVLKTLKKKGTINIATGLATTESEVSAGDITPTKLLTPNTTPEKVAVSFETFILPQSVNENAVSKHALITVTLSGNTYDATIDAKKTFEGGYEYTYNISLTKTGLSFKATVKDWEDGTGGDIIIN